MYVVAAARRLIKGLTKANTQILLLAALFFLVLGTVGSYLAESGTADRFDSIWDCFWWTLVTMSTVGYGDMYPETTGGQVIAIICMIGGPVLMVSVVGSVVISLNNKWTKGVRGMADIKSKDHIVICGWNAKAEDIINELRFTKRFNQWPITIIDDKIDTKPIDDDNVSFVRGSASEVHVLKKANIEEAKFAIVIAEDETPAADQKTVLTVLAIEDLNPPIISCVEINDSNNAEHVRRAGCDIVVDTSSLTSKMLAMSLRNPVINNIVKELVSRMGNDVFRVQIPQRWVGRPFAEILPETKSTYGVIAIGVERDGESMLNPPSDTIFQEKDFLLVIAKEAPSFEKQR